MTSLMDFFNMFCLHQPCSSSTRSKPKEPADLNIVYSRPLDLAKIQEAQILVIQKNIYRMICNIQPVFFDWHPKKNRTYVKRTADENSFHSVLEKKSQSCWDFPKIFMGRNSDHWDHKNPNSGNQSNWMIQNPELVDGFVKQFEGNFTVIYNYSGEALEWMNSQIAEYSNLCIEVSPFAFSGQEIEYYREKVAQSEFFPLEVQSDCVVIELTKFRDYCFQRNASSFINLNRQPCLEEQTLEKFKYFVAHLLKRTEKLVILLPGNCDILDFITIFDEALFDEDLQSKFKSFCLNIEPFFIDGKLDSVSLVFGRKLSYNYEKQRGFLIHKLVKKSFGRSPPFYFKEVFERLMDFIGIRKFLHFLCEAESLSLEDSKWANLLVCFTGILYSEKLIDYELKSLLEIAVANKNVSRDLLSGPFSSASSTLIGEPKMANLKNYKPIDAQQLEKNIERNFANNHNQKFYINEKPIEIIEENNFETFEKTFGRSMNMNKSIISSDEKMVSEYSGELAGSLNDNRIHDHNEYKILISEKRDGEIKDCRSCSFFKVDPFLVENAKAKLNGTGEKNMYTSVLVEKGFKLTKKGNLTLTPPVGNSRLAAKNLVFKT